MFVIFRLVYGGPERFLQHVCKVLVDILLFMLIEGAQDVVCALLLAHLEAFVEHAALLGLGV
jgi:hypothetical protein